MFIILINHVLYDTAGSNVVAVEYNYSKLSLHYFSLFYDPKVGLMQH